VSRPAVKSQRYQWLRGFGEGQASTIDNDLYGSEITIGVDTALNIALEAIDRLKVTASSHQRAFLIETMGRDCGYLALMIGTAAHAISLQADSGYTKRASPISSSNGSESSFAPVHGRAKVSISVSTVTVDII
jgi:hypothetical protein